MSTVQEVGVLSVCPYSSRGRIGTAVNDERLVEVTMSSHPSGGWTYHEEHAMLYVFSHAAAAPAAKAEIAATPPRRTAT